MLMREEIKAAFEAVLFVSGQALTIDELVEILDVPLLDLQPIIKELILEYNIDSRGLQIVSTKGGYLLCTNPKFTEILTRMTKTSRRKLSTAALETLAIIAYKQPITKNEIERIRGVKSDKVLNNLIEQKFIEGVSTKNVLGKPVMYATSNEFLRVFGLTKIEDLPVWQEEEQ